MLYAVLPLLDSNHLSALSASPQMTMLTIPSGNTGAGGELPKR